MKSTHAVLETALVQKGLWCKLSIEPSRVGFREVEDRGFRVIEIWELQNDLVAGWPFVPFAHMSGLHAADMHKIDLSQEIWPRKVRRRFIVK